MIGIAAISLWLPWRGVLRSELAALLGGAESAGMRPVAGADEDALTLAWDALTRFDGMAHGRVAVALDDPSLVVRAAGVLGRASGRTVIELGSGPRCGWDLLASGAAGPGDLVWGASSWARADEPAATWHADAGAAIAWRDDAPLAFVGGWQAEGPLPIWRQGPSGCALDWSAPDSRALFALCEEGFAQLGIDPGNDRIALSCPVPSIRKQAGRRGWKHLYTTDFDRIGYARGADPAFVLAQAVKELAPGERVAVIAPGGGVSMLFFERRRDADSVQVFDARWDAAHAVPPGRWAAFRRRDGHSQTGVEMSASLGWREAPWQLERLGFRCAACGELSWPAQQNCIVCGGREGGLEPVAATGVVFTATSDYLHPSLDPPTAMIVADMDGGGRAYLQGTDDLAHAAPIGTPVELTLRRYHDGERGDTPHYFWKLRSRA